ncbi:MAG: hypothetical protein MR051_02665 [Lentisphaeria bacterium]|nr:hypothetical protein [Lentisphaeria bacterium]
MKKIQLIAGAVVALIVSTAAANDGTVLSRNSGLDGENGKVVDWGFWQDRKKSNGRVQAVDGTARLLKVSLGSMFQEIKGIIPGGKYKFTVRARVHGERLKPMFAAYLVDANDRILKKTAVNGSFGAPGADGWMEGALDFPVPEGVDFDLVRITFGSRGTGSLGDDDYVDFDKAEFRQISVPRTAAGGTPVLSRNSGLDTVNGKVAEWGFWQDGKKSKGRVRAVDGTARLIKVAVGCMFQEIKEIVPGGKYTFSVRARVHGERLKPMFAAYLVNANDKILGKTAVNGSFGEPDADGWREGSLTFCVPEGVDFALIRITFGSRGTGSLGDDDYVEFDKAEFRQVSVPTGAAAAPSVPTRDSSVLNLNGDLDGAGGKIADWKFWQDSKKSKGVVRAVNGTARLIRIANGCLLQEIDGIVPGGKYAFTARARVHGGQVVPTLSAYLVDANDRILKKTMVNGSFGEADADGWRNGSLTFDVPRGVNFALLRIMFGSRGSGSLSDDDYVEFDKAELRQVTP